MRNYLVCDNGTQWFCYIIRVDNEDKVVEYKSLPSFNSNFLVSIYSREHHFTNKEFLNVGNMPRAHYYGWPISAAEYNKISRIIDLYPLVQEYNKLVDYDL